MIRIFINGTVREIAPGLDIVRLLAFLELIGQPLLVERNGNALLRSEWTEIELVENDRIELVRVVAGG